MNLAKISTFFTEETLDKIVQNEGGTHHKSWSFGLGFKKGDSYLSDVYRLKIIGTNGDGDFEINSIVKCIPKNLARRKLFRCAEFFRNEINFYKTVLPAFELFQKTRKPKQPFNEYPKCYSYYCDGENDFIVLEDISIGGFGAPSRQEGVDLQLCEIIMRSLGRFHAVSLAFNDLDPTTFGTILNSLEEIYYAEKNRQWYAPFMKDAIHVASDALVKEYPESEYSKKGLNFINDKLYDTLINIVHTRNKFSVIGHGDCWMPNFLVKYAGSEPDAVKIIDFQLARYASTAVDISFFIYSCTRQDLRENHYDKLLRVYHESACELIRDLGSNPEAIFPFSALQSELKEFGRFGVGMSIESLPLSIMDDEELADLDSLVNENAILTDIWKIYPIKTKDGRLRIADVFKHAVDNGYL